MRVYQIKNHTHVMQMLWQQNNNHTGLPILR